MRQRKRWKASDRARESEREQERARERARESERESERERERARESKREREREREKARESERGDKEHFILREMPKPPSGHKEEGVAATVVEAFRENLLDALHFSRATSTLPSSLTKPSSSTWIKTHTPLP